MKFKIGDKVKLNKNIKNFKYGRGLVSYDEIGKIIETDGKELSVMFPSHNCWAGLEKELELVNKGMFFKKLPNNYTGTIEVENGYIVEKEILDEEEKEYLKAVIRPFKDRVKFIFKTEYNGECFIEILLNNDKMIFPSFKKGTMYNGMGENKEYTLKELGLDE